MNKDRVFRVTTILSVLNKNYFYYVLMVLPLRLCIIWRLHLKPLEEYISKGLRSATCDAKHLRYVDFHEISANLLFVSFLKTVCCGAI